MVGRGEKVQWHSVRSIFEVPEMRQEFQKRSRGTYIHAVPGKVRSSQLLTHHCVEAGLPP